MQHMNNPYSLRQSPAFQHGYPNITAGQNIVRGQSPQGGSGLSMPDIAGALSHTGNALSRGLRTAMTPGPKQGLGNQLLGMAGGALRRLPAGVAAGRGNYASSAQMLNQVNAQEQQAVAQGKQNAMLRELTTIEDFDPYDKEVVRKAANIAIRHGFPDFALNIWEMYGDDSLAKFKARAESEAKTQTRADKERRWQADRPLERVTQDDGSEKLLHRDEARGMTSQPSARSLTPNEVDRIRGSWALFERWRKQNPGKGIDGFMDALNFDEIPGGLTLLRDVMRAPEWPAYVEAEAAARGARGQSAQGSAGNLDAQAMGTPDDPHPMPPDGSSFEEGKAYRFKDGRVGIWRNDGFDLVSE